MLMQTVINVGKEFSPIMVTTAPDEIEDCMVTKIGEMTHTRTHTERRAIHNHTDAIIHILAQSYLEVLK